MTLQRFQSPESVGDVVIRVGLPLFGGRLFYGVGPDVPKLVSANALFCRRRDAFFDVDMLSKSHRRIALDSAGFVATRHYGGAFPWSIDQYVELGALNAWDWWAQMDLCCEPEIAGDRAIVRHRVKETASLLDVCSAHARYLRDAEGASWASLPMPVLQGWEPGDYVESASLADRVLDGAWPALVGVGSVCRRKIGGADGVVAVVRALDRVLPAGVRLHLFGVKSDGLAELSAHPRVASVDSCAWDFRARVMAREAGISNTVEHRLSALHVWMEKQNKRKTASVQMGLL
jgi:hypothetical protein